MCIYAVAVYAEQWDGGAVIYMCDAIELDGIAWIVLEWDSEQKRYPMETLQLQEERLTRCHPPDAEVLADWHYIVPIPRRYEGTLH